MHTDIHLSQIDDMERIYVQGPFTILLHPVRSMKIQHSLKFHEKLGENIYVCTYIARLLFQV